MACKVGLVSAHALSTCLASCYCFGIRIFDCNNLLSDSNNCNLLQVEVAVEAASTCFKWQLREVKVEISKLSKLRVAAEAITCFEFIILIIWPLKQLQLQPASSG